MTEIEYSDVQRTGPGTLAGRYMRMFWQPVYRAEDLGPGRAVPIRIMSEDFTLYRGDLSPNPSPTRGGEPTSPNLSPTQGGEPIPPSLAEPALSLPKGKGAGELGQPHLLAFRCAHRGTQLSVGWVENDAIRCRYHGWKYDGSGQCVEQPGEDEAFAGRVRIRSYPIQDYAGLLFAYLGEGAPPPFRRYPDLERPGILFALRPECWPCNYLNRLDNDPDAFHVLYTHHESIRRANRLDQYASRSLSAVETAYGVRTTMVVPGGRREYLHSHMPNSNQIRVKTGMASVQDPDAPVYEDRITWAVPIDDGHSARFEVNLVRITGDDAEEYGRRRRQTQDLQTVPPNELGEAILAGKTSIEELDSSLSSYELFRIEDYVTEVGQGRFHSRFDERLAPIDVGVVLRRKLWQEELRALAEGQPSRQWPIPEGLADASY